MKCLNETPEQASGGKQTFVSIVASETITVAGDSANPPLDERELEAEVERRASAMTEVLVGIIEHPAAPRYWGLNE